ncbi:hypothetical protein [Clostridioides sp. ZZV14-6045]|uniref:hypothetical protein n=1 Tax=Clostridioides sp. ZZV14-6045 TaxID=2811489 RepID=UPI001D101A09
MKEEFQKFNLELEEVLIDTPKANGDERIVALIEQLADRQLAKEQVETYEAKKTASAKEREYRELQSKINEQDNLTSSEVHISIEKNNAEAEKAKAEAESIKALAEAEAQKEEKVGKAIASANREKANAYGSAELLIKKEVAIKFAEAIKDGNIDIVPKNIITNDSNKGSSNILDNIVQLCTIQKMEDFGPLKSKEDTGVQESLNEELTNIDENENDLI